MASLHIDHGSIPSLTGKIALITGGSSGIGLAAARILADKGATVHILDLEEPDGAREGLHFRRCDVTSWADLCGAFAELQGLDYVFANAGASEERDYFADTFGPGGQLEEPAYAVLDLNLRAVLNLVKLASSFMRRHKIAGSIVITTSATAYAPEQSLPVFAAGKLAQAAAEQLVGLIRALRSVLIRDNITINGVAPAATHTRLLPPHLAAPIVAWGLPVSSAEFVGLALVYSATASQPRAVEAYGRESDADVWAAGRWNGRVIFTLGGSYTELEGPIADLRPFWLGGENLELTRRQQAATDFR